MIDALMHSLLVCPDLDKSYPCITHAEGVHLYDNLGNKYLDASSGSCAVTNIGYGLEAVAEVIKEQSSKIAVLPTHAFSSEATETYLKKLVDFAPKGFKRAWTVMSGTEAVENALKLALQYHQLKGRGERCKIISRWNSYHGNSIFTLDIGGMKNRRELYSKWMHNFPHISPAYSYRNSDGLNETEYKDKCIAEFLKCIEDNDPSTIAAFIAEPVVGAALGAATPPENYFKEIREICDKYDIVFIADEVMTGFGRLGANFGIEKYGITPDIIAAGKGISGGYYPMSAIIVHEKICQIFEEKKVAFLGGHTFACNPVAAKVGAWVIDYLNDQNLIEKTREMGEFFLEELKRLNQYHIVGDIRGTGLLIGVEFVKNKVSKEPFPAELKLSKLIFNEALSKGVIIYPGGGTYKNVAGDHVLLCPPLTINKLQIIEIVNVLSESISRVQEDLKEFVSF